MPLTLREIESACSFARALAFRMVSSRDLAEDAAQSGALAVCRAAQRYDPTRGVGWVTYAGECARGAILKTFRSSRTRLLARDAERGRPLNPALLQPYSLDEKATDGDGDPIRFVDIITDPAPWPGQDERDPVPAEVLEAIRDLAPRLRAVLVLRFWDGLSQTETGKRLGIGQMHTSRLQAQALDQVRRALGIFQD